MSGGRALVKLALQVEPRRRRRWTHSKQTITSIMRVPSCRGPKCVGLGVQSEAPKVGRNTHGRA